MDELLQRASFLIQRRKYREAEAILRSLLAQDPQNARTLYLYCEVKLQLGETDAAMRMINTAIGVSPADDRLFYRRARIHMHRENIGPATEDFQTAIRLNPEQSEYFAALAVLYSLTKTSPAELAEALHLAERSLELSPDNVRAQNARSTVLRKLGRHEESDAGIQNAFSQSPENAYTHANYGWGLLEQGDTLQAMKHFREALRINPSHAYAKAGLKEALKLRYWLYRIIFRYNNFLLDPSTDPRGPGMVLFGAVFLVVLLYLLSLSGAYTGLQPYVTPIGFFIIMLSFSSLYFIPVGNLLLRFSAYGRHLLHKTEITASTLAGVCIALSLAGLTVYLFTLQPGPLAVYMVCFTLVPHLNVWVFRPRMPGALNLMTAVSVALGVSTIVWAFISREAWNLSTWAFFIWFFAYFQVGEKLDEKKK